jgi:hypothetical protein
MASVLPASASLTAAAPALAAKGLVAAPGIFSTAAPALGGLKTLAGPGLLNTMGMSPLAGLAGSTGVVPTATGLTSLYSTVPALTSSPAAGGLLNTLGMSPLGGAQAIVPGATAAGQSAALQAAKANIIGAGTQAQMNAAQQLAMQNLKQQAVGGGTQSLMNTAAANAGNTAANTNIVNAINQNVAGGAAKLSPGVAAGPAPYTPASPIMKGQNFLQNAGNFFKDPSVDAAIDYATEHPYASAAGAYGLYNLMQPKYKAPEEDLGMIRPYEYNISQRPEAYAASPGDTSEQRYFNTEFVPLEPYKAKEGGLMSLAVGGPVEQMASLNAEGANTGYPMARINSSLYSNSTMQRPQAVNTILSGGDAPVGAYNGEPRFADGGTTTATRMGSVIKDVLAPADTSEYKYDYNPKTMRFTQTKGPNSGAVTGGIAPLVGAPAQSAAPAYTAPPALPYQSPAQQLELVDFYKMLDERLKQQAGGYAAGGGISGLQSRFNLGGYSDGGRLLKGPGDGVSDSIPAVIGERQPARLADGEFVIPARIVSEIGNGSTDAGARKLYAMMDRVQKARRKTVGKNRVAANTKSDKYLPA